MPPLTPAVKRQRMIDWYNWRKEIPRSRTKILRYEETIRELEEELAERDRLIAEREKRIRELEEEVGKLKGTRKKLQEIVFKPEEKAEREAINMSCITTLLKQGKDLFQEVPILWKISRASANS